MSAVQVRDLHKSYGTLEVLQGVSFEIEAGEVFGLLGPNGAGKTTTVEILEGYRKRDGGSVSVLDTDPAEAGPDWRERIGVVLQSSAMYETLTVAESIRQFAGYFSKPRDVDEVVEPGRARREAGHARPAALGRPAAPARPRARAGRRPGDPLPRRADDRLRSRRPPRRLGRDPLAALARQDDPADDALPRRGRAARRPGRRPARRPDRRGRKARRS